jgi:hypothetical protein
MAALGAALLVPAAVALAASGTFTGTTAQGKTCGSHFRSKCAVRVTVANGYVGKAKTGQSHVFWRASCKSGKFLTGETAFWGKLNSHHSLTIHGKPYTESGLGNSPRGPVTAKDTVNITVHVTRKVTGTVNDTSVVYDGSHVVDHCHTGTVHFTARR